MASSDLQAVKRRIRSVTSMNILTHCNAGSLATAMYGTCLAPIYLGNEKGYDFHVYADETRPLLQGARLTAWELQKAGTDVTLICDNMASTLMYNLSQVTFVVNDPTDIMMDSESWAELSMHSSRRAFLCFLS